MKEENDFGFSLVENSEKQLKYKEEDINIITALKDLREKTIKEIIDLVVPLLDNLAKDPEKDIRWPNRDVKLKEFKEKLLKIAEMN